MKKIILFLLLAIPSIASADDSGKCGWNLTYEFTEANNTLTISGTGSMSNYSWLVNHSPWYSYSTEIMTVIINEGVTSLGDYAFHGCSNLNSITIPNSVKFFGNYPFYGCRSLETVTIPTGMTSIGKWSFTNSYVKNVTIPESVTTIEESAFYGCYELTTIDIPHSVKTIGTDAFRDCTRLASVSLSSQITTIEDRIFFGCKSLVSILIPQGVTKIGVSAFEGCSKLSSINIPSSIKTIDSDAFRDCDGLSSVHISDLEAWCRINHNSSYSSSLNPLSYAYHLFLNGTEIKDLVIPNSVTIIKPFSFQGCSSITSVTIHNNVKSIEANAFKGGSSIISINIPNSVTSIGKNAFWGCSSLTSVTIPNSVKYIDEGVFRDCSSLTSVVIPSSVATIEDDTFSGCTNLANITIPNSVEKIGMYSFQDCNTINKVICLAEKVPNTSAKAFQNAKLNQAVLCVPSGSIEEYKKTAPWKNFKYFLALGPEPPEDTYKLTYMIDGEIYKTVECDFASKIIPEPSPTKEGYTFTGWSGIPELMPDHDVTVTGSMVVNKYTLTYMLGAKVYKTVEYEYGATIIPEPDPTIEGYTFSGWNGLPETMPAQNLQIAGKITINRYTITYIVDNEVYKTEEYAYGAPIPRPSHPEKEGYTFSGWSEMPNKMPAQNVTVTGSFNINKYTITYMVDGEDYKTVEYEYGVTVVPESEPTKEGYTFSGWSDIPEKMPAKNVTITGTFTINKYLLTCNVDGEEYKVFEVEYGTALTAMEEPTKEGYTFSGWSGVPETMPANDVTITGSFTVNTYTLTYLVDGEEYKTYEIDYGSAITPEEEPTKEGFNFTGWSDIPETMPAHNVTVTGSFEDSRHSITYILDGQVYKVVRYENGAAVVAEPEPTKEGYTFSGWSEIPSEMPDQNITVTGSFVPNKYTITYMLDGEVYETVEYEYGKKVTPISRPEGNYATFTWEGLPSTMPAHDVVVNANYTEPKSYSMILNFKSGDKVTFVLSDKPVITFLGEKFVVESSTGTIDYLRSDIEDFHFDEIATSVESIEYVGDDKVTIYDMNGRIVAKLGNETLNSAKTYLNGFKSGMYIIKIGNKQTIKYLKK